MNILKSIFKYFNSKLIYLLLIVGIPSILAGFCISGAGFIELIVNFGNYKFGSFVDVYMVILAKRNIWLYLQPVALLGLALGLSLLYATIDKHMRMGEFSIRDSFRKLDYNFIGCVKFVLVIAIAGHLIKLLFAALVFLFYKTAQNVALAWTLTAVTAILMGIIYLVIITMLILWLPTMLHTGAGDNRAFIMSIKQLSPHFGRTFWALSIPLFPYVLLMIINCYFALNLAVVFDVLNFMFFGIWLVITMNTLYYDLNSIEREDLKSIIWSKKMRG